MAKLKGVILGVENVLMKVGDIEPQAAILEETKRLVRFLQSQQVEIVVLTNRNWFVTGTGAQKIPLRDFIKQTWGVDLTWHLCAQGGIPAKQTAASIEFVRNQRGWRANETLFVGNTLNDMRAAVNGKVLLLNAQWYQETIPYGFPCETPKEVARFIDTFCFRNEFWYFRIEDGPIRVYSLAPFSTIYDRFPEETYYSQDFLANVKNELAEDEDFWAKLLSTSTYFDGVYDGVDYITAYPKHEIGQYQKVLVRPMTKFAHCFRTRYVPDLVYRHTTAPKSQYNRATVTHTTQLNTIHIKSRPHRMEGNGKLKQYASSPIKAGSKVMLIDDVCTQGFSFEAARIYLNRAGAEVVSVSFLKAFRHGYESLRKAILPRGAFSPNTVTDMVLGKNYSLTGHIVDVDAATKLKQRLVKYKNWDWPAGI